MRSFVNRVLFVFVMCYVALVVVVTCDVGSSRFQGLLDATSWNCSLTPVLRVK